MNTIGKTYTLNMGDMRQERSSSGNLNKMNYRAVSPLIERVLIRLLFEFEQPIGWAVFMLNTMLYEIYYTGRINGLKGFNDWWEINENS